MKNVLALDYGTKRIGVATGNLEIKIAFPSTVIENRDSDFVLKQISKLCEELGISLIVIGLPLNMEENHEENFVLNEVNGFEKLLRDSFDMEVVLIDERLSSFEAKNLKEDLGKKGSKSASFKDDALAAQIILQRFFDTYVD